MSEFEIEWAPVKCRHAVGFCKHCEYVRKCIAPQKDPQVEVCNCPQPPHPRGPGWTLSKVNEEMFGWGVISSDCPIHGRDIEYTA